MLNYCLKSNIRNIFLIYLTEVVKEKTQFLPCFTQPKELYLPSKNLERTLDFYDYCFTVIHYEFPYATLGLQFLSA